MREVDYRLPLTIVALSLASIACGMRDRQQYDNDRNATFTAVAALTPTRTATPEKTATRTLVPTAILVPTPEFHPRTLLPTLTPSVVESNQAPEPTRIPTLTPTLTPIVPRSVKFTCPDGTLIDIFVNSPNSSQCPPPRQAAPPASAPAAAPASRQEAPAPAQPRLTDTPIPYVAPEPIRPAAPEPAMEIHADGCADGGISHALVYLPGNFERLIIEGDDGENIVNISPEHPNSVVLDQAYRLDQNGNYVQGTFSSGPHLGYLDDPEVSNSQTAAIPFIIDNCAPPVTQAEDTATPAPKPAAPATATPKPDSEPVIRVRQAINKGGKFVSDSPDWKVDCDDRLINLIDEYFWDKWGLKYNYFLHDFGSNDIERLRPLNKSYDKLSDDEKQMIHDEAMKYNRADRQAVCTRKID